MHRAAPETAGRSAWPFVVGVFVISRVFFLLVGALAVALVPGAAPAGDLGDRSGFLDYWAHWDGIWYSDIATRGYGYDAPPSTAFFPLFPLLVRFGAALGGGPAVWGVAISLVCTLFTFYFLYAVAEKLYGRRVARYAVLALAFFPTAFYLNAVYTEAPFLAFSIGCVWAALVRRDFLLAGVFGALASATRNLGVLLVIPLLFEWWRCRREIGVRGLVGLCLVPAGFAGYTAWLWARFGDPTISAQQQGAHWGRAFVDPATAARVAWNAGVESADRWLNPARVFLGPQAGPSLVASNTTNLVFMVLALVVIGIGAALLRPGLSIYTAALIIIPALTPAPYMPLMGMPRYILDTFPVFLVLGILLAGGRKDDGSPPKVWAVAALVLSALIGAALTTLFVTWRWVA